MKHLILAFLTLFGIYSDASAGLADQHEAQHQKVLETPGLVAFEDFVKREPDGSQRFVAHVPHDSPTNYPLDASNEAKEYWGKGREASYADFPLLGRGPFGQPRHCRIAHSATAASIRCRNSSKVIFLDGNSAVGWNIKGGAIRNVHTRPP